MMRGTAKNKNNAPKTAAKTIKGMGIAENLRLGKSFTLFTALGLYPKIIWS